MGSMSHARVVAPRLVVFDLDMCVWSPELFELRGAPTSWDPDTNHVLFKSERVKCFPGALQAMRDVITSPEFSETKIGIASCAPRHSAMKCLSLFEVFPGQKMTDIISYCEIYSATKTKHFMELKRKSGMSYEDMIFFDDCTWGDNCADVAGGCPGVTCITTPQGLTDELWRGGLQTFLRRKNRAKSRETNEGSEI